MKTYKFWLIPFMLALAVLLALTAPAAAQAPNPTATDVAVTGHATSNLARSLITYEIEVRNLGGIKAERVLLTQTLSSVTKFQRVTTNRGTCTGGTSVACVVRNLAPGKAMKITVVVSRQYVPCAIGCQTPIVSKIVVSTLALDPIPRNNAYTIVVR